MYNDDLDALAAEYVLGTLPAEERSHAETMIAVDPGFVEVVRQWERRLGELNVMVEAIEPPAETWDKIKSSLGTVAQSETADLAPQALALGLPPIAARAGIETKAGAEAGAQFEGVEALLSGAPAANVPSSEVATLHGMEADQEPEPEAELAADSEAAPEAELESESELEPQSEFEAETELDPEAAAPGLAEQLLPPSVGMPPQTERNADVLTLRRRVRRWRSLALSCGALAALLAALIIVPQFKPGLIPAGQFHIPQPVAQLTPAPTPTPAPPARQLVGVLQQDPSAPAFLLTVDPGARRITVRTIAAKAEAHHSFELWLFSRTAKPLSLGLIGDAEYTQLPLPADFDPPAMQAATYAVSFEPAGGSKTGAPTGPILFTGRLVELVQPAPPKT